MRSTTKSPLTAAPLRSSWPSTAMARPASAGWPGWTTTPGSPTWPAGADASGTGGARAVEAVSKAPDVRQGRRGSAGGYDLHRDPGCNAWGERHEQSFVGALSSLEGKIH